MIDYSLTHEIRMRLYEVEKPFIVLAGLGPHGGVGGVDLVAMQEKLSSQAFASYVEAQRYLRVLEKTEKLLQQTPPAGEILTVATDLPAEN
jgi:hypothetical protein